MCAPAGFRPRALSHVQPLQQNVSRIGFAGHSNGGGVAMVNGCENPEVAAIVTFASTMYGETESRASQQIASACACLYRCSRDG